MDCPACRRVALARSRESGPLFIGELDETVVFLHEHQRYEGWCVLFLKEHAEHLSDLSIERQTRIFAEVAGVAAAVREVVRPRRINYECLGNRLAHVHWHVIPRYAPPIDPDPRETVWVRPVAEREAGHDAQRAALLVARLRRAIAG